MIAALSVEASRTAYASASVSFFILALFAWTIRNLTGPILRLLQTFALLVLSVISAADRTCITSCRIDVGTLQWLPAASLVLSIAVVGLTAFSGVLWCRRAVTLLASLAVVVHIPLQFFLPRLCPKCLFVVAIMLVGLRLATSSKPEPRRTLARWLTVSLALALVSSVAVIRSYQPPTHVVSLQGLPIASVHESIFPDRSSGILLLTLRGCPACHDAELLLRNLGVKYEARSLNEVSQSSSSPIEPVAPQLLKVDEGVISLHITGFGTEAYKEALQ